MTKKLPFLITFVIGLGFAGGAVYQYAQSSNFKARAVNAKATIASVTPRQATCTSGSGNNKHNYSCTKYDVKGNFIDRSGQLIEIDLFHGLSAPNHKPGEVIEILYDPANPTAAKANSTWSLWGLTITLSLFAVLLLAIGGGGVYAVIRREEEIAWLKQSGHRISARVVTIEERVTKTRSKQGRTRTRYRYTIICEGQDPVTGQHARFESDSLTRHPGESIRGATLDVYVDPSAKRRYYVDLSAYV